MALSYHILDRRRSGFYDLAIRQLIGGVLTIQNLLIRSTTCKTPLISHSLRIRFAEYYWEGWQLYVYIDLTPDVHVLCPSPPLPPEQRFNQ